MKGHALSLIMVAFVLLSGCRRGNPVEPGAEVLQYFPLAAGNTWEYQWTQVVDGREITDLDVVQLGQPSVVDGIKWYPEIAHPCREVSGLTPLACASYARMESRIVSRRLLGIRYSPNETIISSPIKAGSQLYLSHRDTSYTDGNGAHVDLMTHAVRYVRGFENVEVPGGFFLNCVHIVDSSEYRREVTRFSSTSRRESHGRTDEWFASGVGLVKQAVETLSINDTSLTSHRQVHALQTYNVGVYY